MNDTFNRLKIKDLPVGERPYEKMVKNGPQALSDAELLATIIRSGTKNETSVGLAQRILKGDGSGSGLTFLNDISLEELTKIKGIGRVKAIQIKAVMELAKRISASAVYKDKLYIRSPGDVSRIVMEEMRFLKQESFNVIMLDAKNGMIKNQTVFIGSLTTSLIHPREVFSEAVRRRCASVILVHNHPSGDPTPSEEDVKTTRRLVESGNILGINVVDHVIIGDGRFTSLKEQGLM